LALGAVPRGVLERIADAAGGERWLAVRNRLIISIETESARC
jgi:hypothetical protein